MKKDLFKSKAKRILGDYLHEKGAILYSSFETLRKGDLYILGLNPAGVDNEATIGDMIENLENKQTNSYLDEDWGSEKKTYSIGQHPIQKKLKILTQNIGFDLAEVCASNLIFVASRNSDTLNFWGLAKTCWPLHQEILKIVQPKLVITYGIQKPKSAFNFLKYLYAPDVVEAFHSGHGSWNCYYFETEDFNVIGVPHLSYYHVSNKIAVLGWIREKYLESCPKSVLRFF